MSFGFIESSFVCYSSEYTLIKNKTTTHTRVHTKKKWRYSLILNKCAG